MSIKHNKKRNIGLIQEFLARYMAISMVENKPDNKNKALQLIAKHFKKSSELYKEWTIFNSLIKTHVSNKETAYSLIQEAKKASKQQDVIILERQKSTLIHDINHKLNDMKFWDREIKDYKTYSKWR